ncbi:2'-5' RNA ligase family protein [Haloarchaeobius sp. TZWWS8]|uniref:2'-5' RNA ligase family protein n=1 Tax=Haloarchaeobius sp. TZWWS8 TaxID=3446121 RepID=UPI003EB7A1FB
MTLAILAPLPREQAAEIEAIWDDLRERFGLDHTSTIAPHISLHGAATYGTDSDIDDALATVASSFEPFTAHTAGIGVFPAPDLVVYATVIRDAKLDSLHGEIVDAAADLAVEPNPYYEPGAWQPHVTLAHGDLDRRSLGPVVEFLTERLPPLSFDVTELALLDTNESGDRIVARFPLSKQEHWRTA